MSTEINLDGFEAWMLESGCCLENYGDLFGQFDAVVDLSKEEGEFGGSDGIEIEEISENDEEEGLEFDSSLYDLEQFPDLQILFGIECAFYRKCPFLGSIRSRKHNNCDEVRRACCPYYQEEN
jgi:hypothetical protein